MSNKDTTEKTYKKTSHTNYYTIQNWMTHECGLKYPQRDIYAILYGFTQDKTQWVEPTQAYIAELVGISRQSVNENIAKLTEDGWLRKVTAVVPGRGTRSRYQTVTPQERIAENSQRGVNQDDTGCQQELQGVSTTLTGGVNQDDTDNYFNNKKISNPISHTHEDKTSTPSSTQKKEQAAAKAARVSEEFENDWIEYQSIYPKPVKEGKEAKTRKAFNLLRAEKGMDYIRNQIAAYIAYEQQQGRNERFYKNASTFLLEGWANKSYTTKPTHPVFNSSKSELADPKDVAALKAKIAEKYEWPESIPCPNCGTPMLRIGETKMYACQNINCNGAMEVKPVRIA